MNHGTPRFGSLGARLVLAAALLVGPSDANAQEKRDEFYWLGELNKAAAVMVVEQGIVARPLGKAIADAVAQVIADASKQGARRSGDYLQVEQLIIAIAGPDATRLHSGRSRQDISATRMRLFQRDQVLSTLRALNLAREALIGFASAHPDAIVPAYTVGVQAQPVSFGHYILAYTQRSSATRFGWPRPLPPSIGRRSDRRPSEPRASRSIGRAWPNSWASTA